MVFLGKSKIVDRNSRRGITTKSHSQSFSSVFIEKHFVYFSFHPGIKSDCYLREKKWKCGFSRVTQFTQNLSYTDYGSKTKGIHHFTLIIAQHNVMFYV